ncbi:metallophosphoesterase [Cohnella massiliensis]|uniref:metallophosphoesterase n=1 Tax=Cohnella massiliensis TaxID=1816691 RepID=UPI0009BB1ECE|nr:metallophosphoesterase [Cohnella massiliensis]
MNWRMLLFAGGMLAAVALVNFYIGWHLSLWIAALWPAFGEASGWATAAYWAVFYAVALSYLGARLPIRPRFVGRGLKVVGSYYFAVMEFSLLLLPIADLGAAVLLLADRYDPAYAAYAGTAVSAALAALMARGSWNAWNPIVRTYAMEVDKDAGEYESVTVAVASDLHLGNIVGNRHLDRLLRKMEEIKPDLILLPGDVIDEDIEPFVRNEMDKRLSRLKAPLGTYAVLGNHEYYGGHIEEYARRMGEIGIPVLRDETVTVGGGIQIVGRKDKTAEAGGGRLPIARLTEGLDAGRPILVMDHQPYQYEQAAAAGVDVLVSGHTHRGQFAPNHFVTRRLFELDWGYMRKGRMHAVVSSGFGTWGPPIRLASRSEIVELRIRFTAVK